MKADRQTLLQSILIVAAGLVVYWPALWGGWLFDDELDILYNPALRSWEGLRAIWLQPTSFFDYYPLKNTVQWIQWQLWADDPFPYHVTNLVLHLASAFLFWHLLRKLGLGIAWVAGLLLVVHPLAVESVAWNAELKNTLSLPPLLLAVNAYVDYVENGARRRYVQALVWFFISLLCKSAGAPLPAFLLLFAWWRHGKLNRAATVATVPFFVLAGCFALVTIWFQREHGLAGLVIELPTVSRIALLGLTTAFYAAKCLWPVGLMPMYPRWEVLSPTWWHFIPAVGIVVVFAMLWRHRTGPARHAFLALGWYLVFIAPATGLFVISYMRFTWVMDHMAYIALLGFIGLVVAALEGVGLAMRRHRRKGQITFVVALTIPAALLARSHAAAFESDLALWTLAVQRNPGAWAAHNNLGLAHRKNGDAATAEARFRQAIALNAEYAEAHGNLADVLLGKDQLDQALTHFQRAIALNPNLSGAHAGLAKALQAKGRTAEALQARASSVRLDPANVVLWDEYAQALAEAGRRAEAIEQLRQALQRHPTYVEGYTNLGGLHLEAGNFAAAIENYERAIALAPDQPGLHYQLGLALQRADRHATAIRSFERSLQLRPNHASALYGLGFSLFLSGQPDLARLRFQQARAIDPSLPPVDF